MNSWLSPWFDFYKLPLSGNVTQDFSPIASLLSPQFEFNFAGNRNIESEVVVDVASYGKQLGIVSEALLEVANDERGAAVEKLKTLVDKINDVKNRHEEKLENKVKADLEQLKQSDPDLLKKILSEYSE